MNVRLHPRGLTVETADSFVQNQSKNEEDGQTREKHQNQETSRSFTIFQLYLRHHKVYFNFLVNLLARIPITEEKKTFSSAYCVQGLYCFV